MEQLKTRGLNKTRLYDAHCSLGAKMVAFAGWEMPLQYKGIASEHRAVREHVGIFDVSHMGKIVIRGTEAEKFIEYLSTNKIHKKPGTATYTVWCRESGGSVDDLIVFKQDSTHFFVIVNSANRQKDLDHVHYQSGKFKVIIDSKYETEGILAIQGPLAVQVVSKLFSDCRTIQPMHFISQVFMGQEFILSATGYTGAGGFEICAPLTIIPELWNTFLHIGEPEGIEPIGLGARDTLRLEMGYALYGHELSEEIAPTESVSRWTVHWDKVFLGKDALLELENNRRYACGVVLKDKGIAREGYEVYQGETMIGKVTSGTMSPTLNQAIAIILVDRNLEEGENVDIQIRANRCQAEVVKLPFLQSRQGKS